MAHRYAYVIATGDSEQKAKENAKYAASKVLFHIITPQGEKQLIGSMEQYLSNDTITYD